MPLIEVFALAAVFLAALYLLALGAIALAAPPDDSSKPNPFRGLAPCGRQTLRESSCWLSWFTS